ncbi:hypothetical protein GCM10009860_05050 [Microbacterium mitrae]|uniref:Di-and tripeptidase n=1 Tax=Microbacterium mitrae TaxID=664640 RepID=A0A5C8HQV5_9MICO|nr:hypothetical protein [Microbacterium mitrae]TXK05897.1 hypothetical protein FVP60_02660 [Microbacterium mitrae]
MADRVHKIHSLPSDAPWQGGLPPVGSDEHPLPVRMLDRVLFLQRPVVLAHLRSIRLRYPDASSSEIITILERRYLAAVTGGGAAVGATAVVPAIGTGVTLALSGAETLGFLESTTLFAQSIAELHDIPVTDPDRARALVLTLILGSEGTALLNQLSQQAGGAGASKPEFWGELLTKSLPKAAIGPTVDRLKSAFLHRLATHGSASIVGKALPFGIGAAVGAGGNFILGRRVVTGARKAFGAPPSAIPAALAPREGARTLESHASSFVVGTARSAARVASAVSGSAQAAAGRVFSRKRRAAHGSDVTGADGASPSPSGDEVER